MKHLFKNDSGASAVEFALVILPVLMFIIGMMQIAWVIWADNLLHVAVDTASRCGAITTSKTPPCASGNMTTTANAVFAPLSGAVWANNASCSAGSIGLTGSYTIHILGVGGPKWIKPFEALSLTVTAKSCYPTV
jgi:Flp pilus assembly protein TadG